MKHHFPIFSAQPDLIYLNNAATTHKPATVLSAMGNYLSEQYDTLGRTQGTGADSTYEIYTQSKQRIATWIEAVSPMEIVPCASATHASNIVIQSLVYNDILTQDDTVIVSVSEHHCVLVPLMQASKKIGFSIRYVEVEKNGQIDMTHLMTLIDDTVKVVCIQHASNVTGAIQPIQKIRSLIDPSIIFISDLTQSVPHGIVDVGALGIDFGFFSGHKMCADTGIGILYAKKSWLKLLEPSFVGGGAINLVQESGYEIAGLPDRWEPGTTHMTGLVSLASAIDFLEEHLSTYKQDEQEDISYVCERFSSLQDKGVSMYGSYDVSDRLPVFSFYIEGKHTSDVADVFADKGIVLRSGHHCCQPLHESFGVSSTIRMSLYLYNDREDIEQFFAVLDSIL